MFDPVGPIPTMSSKRELIGAKAMEGLKARVIFQIERPLWKEFKVSGVSLPTREVHTSLQTGMIDTINSVPEGLRFWARCCGSRNTLPSTFFPSFFPAEASRFSGRC